MKRINLFFLSLLACLLVGTNAWGQTITFKPSTTEPGSGTPEHQYYLHISTGNAGDYFWGAGTKPRNVAKERGTFAFYKVADRTDDYYIYSVTDSMWVSYNQASSYSKCRGFVQLVDSKPSNYWNITKSSNRASKECYSISPYTSGGSVASIYLNYWQGASAAANKDVSIGLYGTKCTNDDGSGWAIENAIVFSTAEDPIWQTWYMRNNGKNGGYAYYDADNNRFPEVHLDEQPTDAKYQFAFIGSLTDGFKVLCSANRYLTNAGTDNAQMKSTTDSDQATVFQINKSTKTQTLTLGGSSTTCPKYTYGSYYFSIDGKTGAVNDISKGYDGQGLGFWANSGAYADEGSQITIEPSMENGERIEVYYIELEGAPDDAVVAYNGRHITNATTFKAIATSTPADDIELEVSVVGYTYETERVGNTFTITFTKSTTYEYTVHVYGSATGKATYGGSEYENGSTITLENNPIVEANIGATNDGTHTFVRAEVDGSHVNIYYAVQTPTSGKAYYLANVIYKTGRLRFYTYTSGGMVWAENNDITSSTSYIANDAGTTITVSNVAHHQYYMMTADGKFLTWKGSGDGCNSNKGFVDTYNYSEDQGTTTDWTKLAFLPTQNGSHVDDDCDSHWTNSVSVYGRRSTGTTYSNIITKKGDDFDKADANFFYKDETKCYSTIFYLIEATDVVTTAVTFVGKDNQDQTIAAPAAATATYAGVTVPWACPYFRTASIEENSLSANKISGYFDPVITYSPATITWKQNIANYTVNVIGDDSGTGGVTYDGQNHLHNTQFTAPATLTLADLTPIAITGKRALVTLSAVTAGAATITVNYYRGSEIRPTFVGSSDDRTTGECPANLVDEYNGEPTKSKWGLGWTSSSTAWITVQADATILKAYDLYNANDTEGNSGRRWKNWKIEGSLDNATWTTIEAAADHDMITTNYAKNSYYVLDNTTPYNYYKITINSNYGGGMIQMSDLKMFMDYRGALGQLLTDVQAISWGTTPGYYAYPEDYETKLSTAQGVYNNAESTDEQLKAQGQIISGMIVNKTVVMPQAGHFYTLLNPNSSKYMLSVNHQGDDHTERLEVATSENITQNKNVFYYNDSKLQGYTEGKFVVKSSDSECQANLDNTGSAIAFVHKNNSTHFYLNINPDDETKRYLLVSSKGYISAQPTKDATCEWQLVDVTDNIYTVSFAEGTPEGANVTYSTTSRTVTKGDVNPWIYSADAISAANLTCGTVTGYNFETPVVAETPNRTITVTYKELLSEGLYYLTNTSNNCLSYDGTTYSTTIAQNMRDASCVFYINGNTVKAQGQTVSDAFEYKADGKLYKGDDAYEVHTLDQFAITVNGLTGSSRKYATFCAPFSVSIPPTFDAYNATVNTETGVITLSHITSLDAKEKVVDAGTPVLIHSKDYNSSSFAAGPYTKGGITYLDDPSNNDTSTAFKGSFVKTSFAELTGNNYVLGASNGVIGFYKMKENANLRANSAYVQIPSTTAKGFSISFEDDPTGINDVDADADVDMIYNLGGQKLNKLQKGINIVNGKKVYVK